MLGGASLIVILEKREIVVISCLVLKNLSHFTDVASPQSVRSLPPTWDDRKAHTPPSTPPRTPQTWVGK